jgi:hypothetical protein
MKLKIVVIVLKRIRLKADGVRFVLFGFRGRSSGVEQATPYAFDASSAGRTNVTASSTRILYCTATPTSNHPPLILPDHSPIAPASLHTLHCPVSERPVQLRTDSLHDPHPLPPVSFPSPYVHYDANASVLVCSLN